MLNFIKGSMHFAKKIFFKKYHPVSFSTGLSGHDGDLGNVLGLVCLYCEFFENDKGPLKISVKIRKTRLNNREQSFPPRHSVLANHAVS